VSHLAWTRSQLKVFLLGEVNAIRVSYIRKDPLVANAPASMPCIVDARAPARRYDPIPTK